MTRHLGSQSFRAVVARGHRSRAVARCRKSCPRRAHVRSATDDAAAFPGRPVRGDPTGCPIWDVQPRAAAQARRRLRTVTAALESAWPKERKQPPKRGSRLDAYRVVIDDWLRSDSTRRGSSDTRRSGSSIDCLTNMTGPGWCRTGWSASTSPPDAVRFASRSDGNLPTRSSARAPPGPRGRG